MASAAQLNEIQKIQVQCLQLINNTVASEELHKVLKIIDFDNLVKMSLCKLDQRVTHKILPVPIQHIFHSHGGRKQHRYPMRNKNTPNIQKHHDVKFNKSFLCQSIVEFSKLPTNLKTEKYPVIFDRRLKKFYIPV